MTAKKGGLNMGKGLQSLIPGGKALKQTEVKKESSSKEENKMDSEEKKKTEETENGVTEVKISLVIPNAEQPRREFDEAALSELAESISIFGVLQPLLVQKKGRYYEIIAGERRWRAAKLAGLKKVPVIVKEYSNQEVMEISLIENIQREDLKPIEEAMAFKRLIEEFELKQSDLASRVSKSRTAIANSMRLLKLDEREQKILIDGLLSSGHARALLALEENEAQFELATRIVSEALSVRETEKIIQKMKKPAKETEEKAEDAQLDEIFNSIEEQLKLIVGSKVSIKRKSPEKGKIEIEYYSSEELDRIIDLFHKAKGDEA